MFYHSYLKIQQRKKRIATETFLVHLSNQEAKEELKSINITKMEEQDTLCNWILNARCVLCDANIWER